MLSKTTISGVIGLLGTLLTSVGLAFQHEDWGRIVMQIGIALGGANAAGNMYAKDATPVKSK